jgi:flagellar motor switch protein FliN/FliY
MMAIEPDNREGPLLSALCAANQADLEAWRHYLDLPVTLAVELGRTRLTARAILGLELNSIIQLPRSTGEGVDVLAGDRVIARGEIIMIEDRTGVRINQVVVQEQE